MGHYSHQVMFSENHVLALGVAYLHFSAFRGGSLCLLRIFLPIFNSFNLEIFKIWKLVKCFKIVLIGPNYFKRKLFKNVFKIYA